MASVIEASVIPGKAEKAGAVYPRREKAQQNLIHVHKYLMEGVKKREADFLVMPSERTRENGQKLKYR